MTIASETETARIVPPETNDADQLTPPAPPSSPPPVAAEPEPELDVIEPEPELDMIKPEPELDVIEPEPGTDVALAADTHIDISTLGEKWPYEWTEFKGDKLGIRLPNQTALGALALSGSKYTDPVMRTDLTNLFMARHLSPESYGRVMSRMMDPDEEEYNVETVGELFGDIVAASVEAEKAAKVAKTKAK